MDRGRKIHRGNIHGICLRLGGPRFDRICWTYSQCKRRFMERKRKGESREGLGVKIWGRDLMRIEMMLSQALQEL